MRNHQNIFLTALALLFFAVSCHKDKPVNGDGTEDKITIPTEIAWDGTKRADITYQLLVYSFADSDGDGIGDFKGIQAHLDYFDALGVNALWLSPVHPSASYHGYDVADYYALNPKFGTEADFQGLIDAAHARGIKIYMDYVLNHMSAKGHVWPGDAAVDTWFTKASASADNAYRDYFLFSANPAADIAAGKFPMIERGGYDSGQWFAVPGGPELGAKGRYHFHLDWTSPSAPKVTVTEAAGPAQVSNPSESVQKYLYFGAEKLFRFYQDPSNSNLFDITVDLDTDWGFLIRTSSTSWDAGTKWGASSGSQQITLGTAKTLNNEEAKDITFGQPELFHSHFWTDWFADLNYGAASSAASSPAFKDVAASADKWLRMGVDGFRLDAVKHIYHNASSDENPTFLKTWYDRCNQTYRSVSRPASVALNDIYMVGEQFAEASEVAPYYKGLPAFFEFSFWWRLKDALNSGKGNRFAKDILGYQAMYRTYRANAIEATKLSNHDEDRAASDLGRNVAKIKQAAAVLLTASGAPYIYQGEELGYWGTKAKGDEYVRAPIKWVNSGKIADGALSGKVDPAMLTADISVETQTADKSSLLSVYRYFATLRNAYPALAQGAMSEHAIYNSTNTMYPSLACWYRTATDGSKMLVAHNFSVSSVLLLPFADNLSKPVAQLGSVIVEKESDAFQLTLGPNSSVVFAL